MTSMLHQPSGLQPCLYSLFIVLCREPSDERIKGSRNYNAKQSYDDEG